MESPQEKPNGSKEVVVSLRGLFSDSLLFGLGSALDRILGLLFLPITASLLGPEGFGVVSLYNTTTIVLGLFAMMGMPQAFFRFRAELDVDGARKLISAAFWMVSGAALVWIPLVLVFAEPITQGLLGQPGTAFAWCLCVSTYGQSIKALADTRLQSEARLGVFLKVNAVGAILMRGLGLYLVVRGLGPLGMVTGEAVGMAVTAAALGGFALNDLRFEFDRASARRLLRYGLSLTPGTFSDWLLAATDRYALRGLAAEPFRALGFYSVAQRAASVMSVVGQAIVLGWRRFAFQNMHSDGEGRRLLGVGATTMIVLAGYVAFSVSVLGDDLIHWTIGDEFEAADPLVPLLTAAAFAAAMQGLLRLGLLKSERTGIVSLLALGAATLNIILNIAMIPRWGVLGAAWATVISIAVHTIVVWRTSASHLEIPVDGKKIGAACMVFASVGGLCRLATTAGPGALTVTLIQVLLIGCTPLLLARTVLGPAERARLWALASRRGRRS